MLICETCNRSSKMLVNGECGPCRESNGKQFLADCAGGCISRRLGVRYDGYQPLVKKADGRSAGDYLQFTDMDCALGTFAIPYEQVSMKAARMKLIAFRASFISQAEEVAA